MSSTAAPLARTERPASFYCIANCRLVKRPDGKLLVKIVSCDHVGYESMNTLTGSPKCAASRRA
jgi:hypothetical protein